MNTKRWMTMLLAGAMTVSLTACGGTADGTQTAAGSEEPHTVAVILKTLNSEYWKCVAAGVEQAAADLGCEVQLQGPPSETSYDEQINEIETTLTAGEAEALVLAPLQPEVAANAVEHAEIPVLAVDTTFSSDRLLSYIGVSNEGRRGPPWANMPPKRWAGREMSSCLPACRGISPRPTACAAIPRAWRRRAAPCWRPSTPTRPRTRRSRPWRACFRSIPARSTPS